MAKQVEAAELEEVLDAIADVQRRKMLLALLEHNPQDDRPVEPDHSNDEVVAVRRLVEMQRVNLPKLEEYGFVTWHPESNEVVKGPDFEQIRPFLELLDDHEDELPDGWV